MEPVTRKNQNRGYMQLVVWQDAKDYYVLTATIFRKLSYELKRVASQQIASVYSIHRNIAEGYGRRSLNEYLQFLNLALGSVAESVSGLHVYRNAMQITPQEFESADAIAYKLENGMIRLIRNLQIKRESGDWNDSFIVRDCNEAYQAENTVVHDR